MTSLNSTPSSLTLPTMFLKLTNMKTSGTLLLSSLQQLYAPLKEPDLVLGVAAVRGRRRLILT